MTDAIYPNEYFDKSRSSSSAVIFTLSAVFLVFAILSALMCATVPALRSFIELPLNESALSYTFTDVNGLFVDSFTLCAEDLILMLVFSASAFSLFCGTAISLITALKGCSCGSVLFLTLMRNTDFYCITVNLIFHILSCVLVFTFGAVCIGVHESAFTANKKKRTSAAVKLIFCYLSFGGALCLLKMLELLLL